MNATVKIAPAKPVAEWLRIADLQLEGMRPMRDNWDGYGADAPTAAAIDAAVRDIRTLLEYDDLPIPYGTATPDGGAALMWEVGKHQLDLEWKPDGHSEFLYYDIETRELEGGSFLVDSTLTPAFLARLRLIRTP